MLALKYSFEVITRRLLCKSQRPREDSPHRIPKILGLRRDGKKCRKKWYQMVCLIVIVTVPCLVNQRGGGTRGGVSSMAGCVWRFLNRSSKIKCWRCTNVCVISVTAPVLLLSAMCRKFAEVLSYPNHRESLQEAAVIDAYVAAYWYPYLLNVWKTVGTYLFP